MLNLNITSRDVIGSYKNGPEHVYNYTRIKNLMESDLSCSEIVAACPDVPGVKSRVRDIKKGSKPNALRGVEYLEKLGLLPMNDSNSKLPLFNLLVSMTFWNGSRRHCETSSAEPADIEYTNPEEAELITAVLETLKCRYTTHPACVDYDQKVSRLVKLSGYPAGSKNDNNLTVPDYIESALQTYCNEEIPDEDRNAVLPYIIDFIHTLLAFRTRYGQYYSRVYLKAFSNLETAEKQGKEIREMLNIAFPGLLRSSRTIAHRRNGVHFHRLSLEYKDPRHQSLRQSFRDRIHQVIGQI